ncbi:MAG: N-acetyltransferase, partial [Methylovirgula sp.]
MSDLTLVLVPQVSADQAAIEKLDERVFGPGRFARSAYRLREGVAADLSLSYVARVGRLLVGANRMTPIRCGGKPALLLGPLSVEPAFRS